MDAALGMKRDASMNWQTRFNNCLQGFSSYSSTLGFCPSRSYCIPVPVPLPTRRSQNFLLQGQKYFDSIDSLSSHKVTQLLGLLMGKALSWATAVWHWQFAGGERNWHMPHVYKTRQLQSCGLCFRILLVRCGKWMKWANIASCNLSWAKQQHGHGPCLPWRQGFIQLPHWPHHKSR